MEGGKKGKKENNLDCGEKPTETSRRFNGLNHDHLLNLGGGRKKRAYQHENLFFFSIQSSVNHRANVQQNLQLQGVLR